ncbi:MAG: tRNA (adenosine(37)-N6)-threonylcarbamoyltransferase complex transferase subunit TsaD [Candidatus Eisenbacteria bacterium]|uniref:tRNA N6-adenosine threonylcarbamoyltransferase n=1 Tax=Eiseniibacteriota bacterium TaxID=2212470 RepID=A0A956M0F7_UNCEI|nr:tRNA (adenosine(37)-N6)-threonylcarbamoyltransferase complex transferase subunit TsaD [Candidatus Eisenbacteria bacterium]
MPAFTETDLVLAIETSCDDTCASVVRGDSTVLSSVVSSQGIHAEYVGVVPELASREHARLVLPAVRQALDQAGCSLDDIAAFAATRGPGLIGCLLVGMATAKGLSLARNRPFVGINHIDGHLAAIRAERVFDPPYVALVASGGHTELMVARSDGTPAQVLGATRDDAAGEAFDKVAKLLGLGFPGGPVVDRLAKEGNPEAIGFPRAWLGLDRGRLDFDFSFSGLKTAVKLHVERHPLAEDEATRARQLADVCASFQEAVVDVLIGKMEAAARHHGIDRLLLAGGVACNSRLRARTTELAERLGGEAAYARPALCGDNAAMIGLVAVRRLRAGERDPLELPAVANLDDLVRV